MLSELLSQLRFEASAITGFLSLELMVFDVMFRDYIVLRYVRVYWAENGVGIAEQVSHNTI